MRASLAVVLLLAACGGPRRMPESPIDIEFGRIEEGARGAFARRDLAYAELLYERLLREARLTDDPTKIADAAYNLAAVQYARGKGQTIRPLLSEARRALERSAQPTAEVAVLRARVELEAGAAEVVLAVLSDLLTDTQADPLVREQARVLAGLAELRLGREEPAGAHLASIEAEAQQASRGASPDVERLRARIFEARGRYRAAAEALDREAQLRQARSQYGLMADALEQAGQAWSRDGDTLAAAERWFRAAKSRQGGGDEVAALSLCLLALEALDSAEAESLGPRASELIEGLRDLTREIDPEQISAAEASAAQVGSPAGGE